MNDINSSIYSKILEIYPIIDIIKINIQNTKPEFEGDITINVIPFVKILKENPKSIAENIGNKLLEINYIDKYNVIHGFLNVSFNDKYFQNIILNYKSINSKQKKNEDILVEYSSPNTNKPLHLGHLRNIFLGDSISRIFEYQGYNVIRTQIINDRGIHICKSMIAWILDPNKKTIENTNMKGDHLVGEYYVKYNELYSKQVEELILSGIKKEEAEVEANIYKQAQELLLKWENQDPETIDIWKMMNSWVYSGFEQTYDKLNVKFDKTYYESNTYTFGKKYVYDGIKENLFYKKDDNSIWIDLSKENLDDKLLLRSNGSSLYVTQDIGTAKQRSIDYPNAKSMIYTVGNEQDHYFKVLFKIFDKLKFEFSKNCFHLSYGMVELPNGKMKSREGTVVDADNFTEDIVNEVKNNFKDRLSSDLLNENDKEILFKNIGIGAIKYFLLKVDPSKNMIFNPQESINLTGNTAPFVQYTYARIQSLLNNRIIENKINFDFEFENIEREIIKTLLLSDEIIEKAAKNLNPSNLANYIFDLSKLFNSYYQSTPILNNDNENIIKFRLLLSYNVGLNIKLFLNLLGITVVNKM